MNSSYFTAEVTESPESKYDEKQNNDKKKEAKVNGKLPGHH
jgi:hypothetical protein